MNSRDQIQHQSPVGEAAATAERSGNRSAAGMAPAERSEKRPTTEAAATGRSGNRPGVVVLRLLAAAGLAVDAFVHTDLAGRFATGGTLSESRLFLIQGSLAAAAALGIVVRGRRLEAAFGFLVAAAALGAVLLYRFVDVGALGPLPNMYEPIWYTEKAVSAIAEGVAVIACLALFAVRQHQWSGRSAPLRR